MAGRKTTRRRSPGEGGACSYKIKTRAGPGDDGTRWYWRAYLRQPDGTTKPRLRRGFMTKRAALADMEDERAKARKGELTEPSKMLLGTWLDQWVEGARLRESTRASYRKNIRLHIKPYIGDVPLASLTSTRLTQLYVQLEKSGRADHREGEGLSARTVRYIHTILGAALKAAVNAEPALLVRSPASKATPPSAKEARPPEMHAWNSAQLRTFLDWAREKSELHPAWHLLAYTGMRRGELLALRWRDVDLAAGTVSIRRSVGVVRNKGEGATITPGPTKTDTSRVITIDPDTVEILRAWWRSRHALALELVTADEIVFGLGDDHRHPERFSRLWNQTLTRCRRELGEAAPPMIRLHDLRHTHATILLMELRENVKVVSQRLGHASVTVTLTVYAHALPGNDAEAASRFGELVGRAA